MKNFILAATLLAGCVVPETFPYYATPTTAPNDAEIAANAVWEWFGQDLGDMPGLTWVDSCFKVKAWNGEVVHTCGVYNPKWDHIWVTKIEGALLWDTAIVHELTHAYWLRMYGDANGPHAGLFPVYQQCAEYYLQTVISTTDPYPDCIEKLTEVYNKAQQKKEDQ